MTTAPHPPTWLRARAVGLLTLLGLLCGSVPGWTAGFMVTPLNQTLRTRPGARHAFDFRMVNQLGTPVATEIKLADVTQAPNGTPVLHAAGSTPRSCTTWLKTREGIRTVSPRQSETLSVTLDVPGGTTGSYHGALVVRLLGQQPTADRSTTGVVVQAILPIHVIITGTEKLAVELKGCDLLPAEKVIHATTEEQIQQLKGKWALVPRVANTGNSMVRIRGDVLVATEKGQFIGRFLVAKGDPDGQALLPEGHIAFPILLDSALPEARYITRMNLSYNNKRGIEVPLTLVPRKDGQADQGEVLQGEAAQTGLQAFVTPSVVVVDVTRGMRTEKLDITSLEDVEAQAEVRILPCTLDVDGTPIPLAATDPLPWVAVAPAQTRIGPRQTRAVQVRVSRPDTLTTDAWALLELRLTSRPRTPGEAPITAKFPVLVLLRTPESAAKARATVNGVALTRAGEGAAAVAVTLTNPEATLGVFHNVFLTMTPQDGTAGGPAQLEGETPLVLLPNASRRTHFLLPATVKEGKYSCRVTLRTKAGGEEQLAGEFQIVLDTLGQ
jgi:hypothetical protein